MATEEEREFQLEKLKVQLKHQALWSSVTLLIAVEFAVFTSIATTFLSYGLISGNMYYVFVAVSSLVCLYIVVRGTIHYFQGKKIEKELDKNLEKEIQSIRDKFIAKKTEQNENKEEEKTETTNLNAENLRVEYQVLNDTVNRRYSDVLIVESVIIPLSLAIVTFAIIYRTELKTSIFVGLPIAGFIPLLSFILILFLYFSWYTTKKINDISFERMCEIEKLLHLKGHQYVKEQIKGKTWFKVRWFMWHFIFLFLMAMYLFTAYWLFRETVIPPTL